MIQWLFEIDTLKLSTLNTVYSAANYTGAVIPSSFSGITMRWDITGNGLIAPNDFSFDVSNTVGTYSISDFEGKYCTIRLIISGTQYRVWKMKIKRAVSYYGQITCNCVDFLQDFLTGDYPNTPSPAEIWPSDIDYADDDYCIPVVLGTAYIPVRRVNTGSESYYCLGVSGPTYEVYEIHSPRNYAASTWDAGSYDMDGSLDSGYQMLQPKIDVSVDPPGTGMWNGYTDILCKYSRSDTVTKTNPAEWIQYVLEGFGVATGDIDSTSFTVADTLYDSLNLVFNGGWWRKEPRERILSNLLSQVDSYIVQTDKVELYQFSKTPQETITKVMLNSFAPSTVTKSENDSGRVHWPKSTSDPQDILNGKTIVPITDGGATDTPSSTVLECRFMVGQSQNAQQAGSLFFQKKYGLTQRYNFSTTLTALANGDTLSPGQVVSVDNTFYGGTNDMIITDMTINRDLKVDMTGVVL